MNEVTKEIIRKEYHTIYVAEDGSEFESKEECKKYESTAEFVINNAFSKLTSALINDVGQYLFTTSFDYDEPIHCVYIGNADDLYTVNMWAAHYKVGNIGAAYKKYKNKSAFPLGSDAIGKYHVFDENAYDCPYYCGECEELKAYMHKQIDVFFDALTSKKEKEEE